jgi:hypothetical protein
MLSRSRNSTGLMSPRAMYPAIVDHTENSTYIGVKVIMLTEAEVVAYYLWSISHEN